MLSTSVSPTAPPTNQHCTRINTAHNPWAQILTPLTAHPVPLHSPTCTLKHPTLGPWLPYILCLNHGRNIILLYWLPYIFCLNRIIHGRIAVEVDLANEGFAVVNQVLDDVHLLVLSGHVQEGPGAGGGEGSRWGVRRCTCTKM